MSDLSVAKHQQLHSFVKVNYFDNEQWLSALIITADAGDLVLDKLDCSVRLINLLMINMIKYSINCYNFANYIDFTTWRKHFHVI